MRRVKPASILLTAIICAAWAAQAVGQSPGDGFEPKDASLDPDLNLLFNPSFEEGYDSPYVPPGGHPDCPSGTCDSVVMADYWSPWWLQSDPANGIHNPEYKPAEKFVDPYRVHSGARAQQYFTFSSKHVAGIYQSVPAVPGQGYCFRIWGHAWSSNLDDPRTSESTLEQRIGIDPTGGIQWDSPTVVWGPMKQQYDIYGYFDMCAFAQADHITVFTFSRPVWPVKHNDVYWDDAELEAVNERLTVQPESGHTFMADVDQPGSQSAHLTIDLPNDPDMSWVPVLEPGGTITPTVTPAGGPAGANTPVTVTVDSTALSPGVYSAAISIWSVPALPGSPTTVPITLVVAQDIHRAYLPAIR